MRCLVGLFVLAGLLMAACGQHDRPAAPSAGPPGDPVARFLNVASDGYVGDAACFDCHEEQWQGYQDHGMAQSYYPLTPEHVVEDFSGVGVEHPKSGYIYRVYEEDGRYLQEEYRLGPDGEKVHRLVRTMDYVVGSGTAARTYLTENKGRLYELPLTWYTQGAYWDFSPGYDTFNNRFDRLVPDRCMACHNSYPETVPFAEGKYTEVPHGIGCERCHGPGDLHVEARLTAPESPDTIDSTIVNPAHLDLDRALDVCQQCHLHTTVSVLREGRGPFDFRPAQALADHLALFSTEEAQQADQISVISHADRMQQSPCFVGMLETETPMTCVTCHDPHSGFRDKGPAYFNATCQSCHAPEVLQAGFDSEQAQAVHTEAANCFSCHMPKVQAEDAPHASFTDHWIRVVEEAPALPAPAVSHTPPVLEPYFARDEDGPEAQRYEGIAYVVLGRQQDDSLAYEKGITLLEEALADDPEHGEAQFLLGWAHLQRGHVEQAIPPLETSIRIDPGIPERLNALAQAYEAGRRDPLNIGRLYQRALAIQPALADVRINYGRFLETQGRLDDAIEQYQAAIAEQPWLAAGYYNLGTAYLQQNRPEEAEEALQEALHLNPEHTQALGNLGLLYAVQGHTEQARALFEQAVTVAPDNALALGNLGTYHLNAGNLSEAIDLLRRAVEADPAYLDGLLNLALAYFRNDDYAQAERYARQALDVDPTNARARQILAAL